MAGVERMETGLRYRLKRVVRQMADQHRHLQPIYGEFAEALASGAPAQEVRVRFARYREAIEAHFALETDTFFPALHGLYPGWAAELEQLDREHERLLEELAGIGRRLEVAGREEGAETLERFAARLLEHERREERLADQLGPAKAATRA
jgi:hypothetical protein